MLSETERTMKEQSQLSEDEAKQQAIEYVSTYYKESNLDIIRVCRSDGIVRISMKGDKDIRNLVATLLEMIRTREFSQLSLYTQWTVEVDAHTGTIKAVKTPFRIPVFST